MDQNSNAKTKWNDASTHYVHRYSRYSRVLIDCERGKLRTILKKIAALILYKDITQNHDVHCCRMSKFERFYEGFTLAIWSIKKYSQTWNK